MKPPSEQSRAGQAQGTPQAQKRPPAPNAGPQKQVISVKKAMDQAYQFFKDGKIEAAARLAAKIAAERPRFADVHNLMGAILAAQGKLPEAVKAASRATRLAPNNSLFFSNLGEMESRRGKLQEAGIALRQAAELNPNNIQALNNLGILHYDSREFEEAVECYTKALAKDPGYAEANNNMGNALRALGRAEEALDFYQKALLIRENYPEVYNNMASILRDKDQIAEAEHAYRRAIALRPSYLEAHVNLAAMLDGEDRADDALRVLGDALKIDSKHVPTLIQTARTQAKKSNFAQAEQAARLAIGHDPNSAEAHAILGQVLNDNDQVDQALVELETALKIKPELTEANSLYGTCLKTLGRLDDARKQFNKTLELNPRAFGVYANLADLDKFTADSPHLKAMEQIIADAADPMNDRLIPIHFALGKAYDDVGQPEKSFKHYKMGTTLKRAKLNYNEAETFAFFDDIRKVFDADYFAKPPFEGIPSQLPVFIIGMPRSGSTLVEQVLSNHPDTFGAGEIKELSRQLGALRGRFPSLPRHPQIAQKMNKAQFSILAEGYLSKLKALAPNASRVTDKLLTNYFFVGLLHTLYPKAKFIHTKRNPVDTCLSAYTKLFKDDMPHSYDLGELGRYYKKYEELMTHWEKVLPPGTMKTVVYEDVVGDLPKMAREIIEFIDLPWNDACLAFHESSRPVKTASVVQVRQPVYTSSVGRWRRYGSELQPLIEALDYHE